MWQDDSFVIEIILIKFLTIEILIEQEQNNNIYLNFMLIFEFLYMIVS